MSFRVVLFGLLIGASCGLLAVLGIGCSQRATDLLRFSSHVVRPIPIYLIVPLCLVWFGINLAGQVAVVALGTFLILTVHASDAVGQAADIDSRSTVATRVSWFQGCHIVSIPVLLPHLIAGLRLAVATAWSLSVATEMMIQPFGLGLVTLMSASVFSFETAESLAVVLLYAAVAILSDYALRAVAKRYSPHYVPLGLVG